MSLFKGAAKAAIAATSDPNNPVKGFQGLVGLAITFLAGLCFPVLGCLRGKFGERFYLSPERLVWALVVQWVFFWTLKGIGFIWGIFNVDGLYKFFVCIDIIMLFHILRILVEMVLERPQWSFSTGESWPVWNIFKRISWVSDATIRLWVEPFFLLVISLIVMRSYNGAIGAYLFVSSFALLQLESTIFRQRRALYLDHKDSESMELGHNSGLQRLSKPIPINR